MSGQGFNSQKSNQASTTAGDGRCCRSPGAGIATGVGGRVASVAGLASGGARGADAKITRAGGLSGSGQNGDRGGAGNS